MRTDSMHWRFDEQPNGATSVALDMEAFIAEKMEQMGSLEEKITRDLILSILRSQGYKIEEPAE